MKKYITCAMTVLFAMVAVSIAAPDKEAVIAKEKAAWQAFKDKKSEDFKKLISTDLMAVYSHGIYTFQMELDSLAKTEMKSFDLSDMNVVFPDPKTAVITYKAKVDGTQDGKDISGTYNAGSVWRMTNNAWRGIFHSDMKEEPAAKPAG